ncbi:MAG: copper uptake system-associated protein [Paracoccaceae bacterium]
MKHALTLIAALLLSTPTYAHEVKVGDIEIIHAHINAPANGAKSAAGYMAIANSGTEIERLLGVEVGFADMAMLHTTTFSADGVATMAHVETLDIPAGETVVLEPGGMHIMLMGLTQPLTVGDMLPATLILERTGRVEIEFMIDPADGTMDHSMMDHSAAAPATPVQTGDAVTDIKALLKAQFDTPEAPLSVSPITVQGDVAIAGWHQNGVGGRAFLRHDAKGWFVELCSGAGLMQPATLQSLGLSGVDAETLLSAAKSAESAIGADVVALFDGFDGTLVIGRGAEHSN